MVFLTLANSCGTIYDTSQIKGKVTALENKVDTLQKSLAALPVCPNSQPRLHEEVIDGRTNWFYEIDGRKAYVLGDGKSIETYWTK